MCVKRIMRWRYRGGQPGNKLKFSFLVYGLFPHSPPYTMLDEMMARFFRTDFRDYCTQDPTNIVRGGGAQTSTRKTELKFVAVRIENDSTTLLCLPVPLPCSQLMSTPMCSQCASKTSARPRNCCSSLVWHTGRAELHCTFIKLHLVCT